MCVCVCLSQTEEEVNVENPVTEEPVTEEPVVEVSQKFSLKTRNYEIYVQLNHSY